MKKILLIIILGFAIYYSSNRVLAYDENNVEVDGYYKFNNSRGKLVYYG